jgi:hypothetical protein
MAEDNAAFCAHSTSLRRIWSAGATARP